MHAAATLIFQDTRNAVFGFTVSVTNLVKLLMENECTKAGVLPSPALYHINTRLMCMWRVSPRLSLSISLTVCLFPSRLFRKDRRGCVSIREGRRVKLGSHAGGIFRVSWHLGERFQLIRDPCVHFDGFAGE